MGVFTIGAVVNVVARTPTLSDAQNAGNIIPIFRESGAETIAKPCKTPFTILLHTTAKPWNRPFRRARPMTFTWMQTPAGSTPDRPEP